MTLFSSFFNYLHNNQISFKEPLLIQNCQTYSFLVLVPSDRRTSMLGRSLQSDPGARGMCCILAATRGLISLQIWSLRMGWCCLPRIYNPRKWILIKILKLFPHRDQNRKCKAYQHTFNTLLMQFKLENNRIYKIHPLNDLKKVWVYLNLSHHSLEVSLGVPLVGDFFGFGPIPDLWKIRHGVPDCDGPEWCWLHSCDVWHKLEKNPQKSQKKNKTKK